jgi:hypothetical protein
MPPVSLEVLTPAQLQERVVGLLVKSLRASKLW